MKKFFLVFGGLFFLMSSFYLSRRLGVDSENLLSGIVLIFGVTLSLLLFYFGLNIKKQYKIIKRELNYNINWSKKEIISTNFLLFILVTIITLFVIYIYDTILKNILL